MDTLQLDPSLSVGRQPTEDEMAALYELGFKTIINLRMEDEDDQTMSPEQERHVAEVHSLLYYHIPIDPKSLSDDDVDEFCEAIEKAEKPVYIHCSTGRRAGALAMMPFAAERGMSGEEAVRKAERLGFIDDMPQLRALLLSYVERHGHRTMIMAP